MARPGFDRLAAWLCAASMWPCCVSTLRGSLATAATAIICWSSAVFVGACVIDLDGVYHPCRSNDRLLLGMKGSISEFELGVLRARMYDAARSKARRGELRISVPVGYVWDREIGLGFDPDSGSRRRSVSSSRGSASWEALGKFSCPWRRISFIFLDRPTAGE
jgi:hypothetical protein